MSERNGGTCAQGPRLVIVGAGHAGGRCVLALRQGGFKGSITLIGDEPHLPYERPPLSKEYLTAPDEDLAGACPPLIDQERLRELGVEHLAGTRVRHIDRAGRSLRVENGRTLSYDYLVLATGSQPRAWALEGGAPSAVHQVRTRADAMRLRVALKAARRVLVVGGGFIGLEIAASAKALGCSVTVVEAQQHLLARALSRVASEHVRQLHLAQGVDIRLGRRIVAAGGMSEDRAVVLDDGSTVAYDVIVAGIGSVPNTELAVSAGLQLSEQTGGICVDSDCLTSDPDIYAVGDAASSFNALYERQLRLESWDNAESQAALAAASLIARQYSDSPRQSPAGADVPWFWTDQHGLNLQILGFNNGADRAVVRGELPRQGVILHLSGERVIGAELFNSARDRRMIKGWIKSGAAVNAELLRDSQEPLARAAQAAMATLSSEEK